MLGRRMIPHIVWDWNGTLLDDVDPCVDTLNALRAPRRLPAITATSTARASASRSKRFYEQIGFDFTTEGLRRPLARLPRRTTARAGARCGLAPGAARAAGGLGGRGIAHLVISAMESRLLGEMLAAHALEPLLTGYHGREDLSGESKVELGAAAVRGRGSIRERCWWSEIPCTTTSCAGHRMSGGVVRGRTSGPAAGSRRRAPR
jgi:phosphoglycolate phosphatase